MAFLLACPNCGERYVHEFSWRGEYRPRPPADATTRAFAEYVYMRRNPCGETVEWWYHSSGCHRWFLVKRNTKNNADHVSFWFADRHEHLTQAAPEDG